MNIDKGHPIRQRMFWVVVIQSLASVLVMAGLATEVIVDDWQQVAVGILNVLVLAGVLAKGTTDAEENTTPLNDQGEPLNPDYELISR